MHRRGKPKVFPDGEKPVGIVRIIVVPLSTVQAAWGVKLIRRGPKYPAVIERVEVQAEGKEKLDNTVRLVLVSEAGVKGTFTA